MRKDIGLTKREEELMNFLWDYEEPITSNAILKFCENRSWSESYLYVMLRSLQKNVLLQQREPMQYGSQYARRFYCTMTNEEYYVALAAGKDLDTKAFAKNVVAMAVKEGKGDNKELLEQLEQMLKEASEGPPEKEKK